MMKFDVSFDHREHLRNSEILKRKQVKPEGFLRAFALQQFLQRLHQRL